MTDYEILTFLKDHINYFIGVTTDDFDILLSSINPMALDDDKIFQITPLLKQIAEYSLISELLFDDEIDQISYMLENRDNLSMEIFEVSDYCSIYVRNLMNRDCLHPSIEGIRYIQCIGLLYKGMMDTMTKIMENTRDDTLTQSIMKIFTDIDDYAMNKNDINFRVIINKLDEGMILTTQQLMIELKNYVVCIFKNFSLLLRARIEKSNLNISDTICFITGSEINEFAMFISLVGNICDSHPNLALKSLMQELMEQYELYNSYRYYYLLTDKQEKHYLRKDKKM